MFPPALCRTSPHSDPPHRELRQRHHRPGVLDMTLNYPLRHTLPETPATLEPRGCAGSHLNPGHGYDVKLSSQAHLTSRLRPHLSHARALDHTWIRIQPLPVFPGFFKNPRYWFRQKSTTCTLAHNEHVPVFPGFFKNQRYWFRQKSTTCTLAHNEHVPVFLGFFKNQRSWFRQKSISCTLARTWTHLVFFKNPRYWSLQKPTRTLCLPNSASFLGFFRKPSLLVSS